MLEWDNLIKFCAQQFNTTPFCSSCLMSQCRNCGTNSCYNCLTHIHSINTKDDHYTCEKITYNYILKYGYRYVSEMAWAFSEVKNFFNWTHPINIISVGCGPSTELYGAAAVFRNTNLNYYGFDMNRVWNPIQQFNVNNFSCRSYVIQYYNCDFIRCVIENNIQSDILVLNYFFSDFVKYRPQDCDIFINDLVHLIKEGRFTTVIINDVMLLYSAGTGYACMEKIARMLNSSNQDYTFLFQRRHFAVPNQFQFEYGQKIRDNVGFIPVVQEGKPFDPILKCGSIQLIIKTIWQKQS